jgi:hypothetical protein
MNDESTAAALGWASIGIGLSELAAPKQLENLMGIGNGQHTGILRVLGIREIMTGIDILAHRDPTPGIWGRVIGDAMDLVFLGFAAKKTRKPGGLLFAFALVAGVTALDAICAGELSADPSVPRRR